MEQYPRPTEIYRNEEGEITGWKNAFGTFELVKGLTKKVSEETT